MTDAINAILTALLAMCVGVMTVIGAVDGALSDSMARMGFGPAPQTIILVSATIVLMVFAVRVLGGILGWLLLILLLLLAVHHMMPVSGWTLPVGGQRAV